MFSVKQLIASFLVLIPILGKTQSDIWQHIDPTSVEAKVLPSSVGSKILFPLGGTVLIGSAAYIVIANSKTQSSPVLPPTDPSPTPFEINNDDFTAICGQTSIIDPLQNDIGQNLQIDSLIGAPAGTLILADNSILLTQNLSDNYSFYIVVSDGNGNTSNSLVSIVVLLPDFELFDDYDSLAPGESAVGNVLINDICTSCYVTGFDGITGGLVIVENGDFIYSVPASINGEVTFTVYISDSCGQSGTSQLIFFLPQQPCTFIWPGSVDVVDSNCGLNNGSASPSENSITNFFFSWSNGIDGLNNTGLSPGEYQLFVTDSLTGCIDSVPFFISELPPNYVLTIENIPGFCGAPNDFIVHLMIDSENPVDISITGPSNVELSNWSATELILSNEVNMLPGIYIINISHPDFPDCAEVLSVEVANSSLPQLILESSTNPAPPNFNNGSITLLLQDFLLPADIILNGEFLLTAFEPLVILEGLVPGEYEIIGNDLSGCLSAPLLINLLPGGVISPVEYPKFSLAPTLLPSNENLLILSAFQFKTPEGAIAAGVTPIQQFSQNPLALQLNSARFSYIIEMNQLRFNTLQNGSQTYRSVWYSELSVSKNIKLKPISVLPAIGFSAWKSQFNPAIDAFALNAQLRILRKISKKANLITSLNFSGLVWPITAVHVAPAVIIALR